MKRHFILPVLTIILCLFYSCNYSSQQNKNTATTQDISKDQDDVFLSELIKNEQLCDTLVFKELSKYVTIKPAFYEGIHRNEINYTSSPKCLTQKGFISCSINDQGFCDYAYTIDIIVYRNLSRKLKKLQLNTADTKYATALIVLDDGQTIRYY